jgi:hypothetical protein
MVIHSNPVKIRGLFFEIEFHDVYHYGKNRYDSHAAGLFGINSVSYGDDRILFDYRLLYRFYPLNGYKDSSFSMKMTTDRMNRIT